MNIFVSDEDPVLAAKNLDDRRLVKMVLETGQLLSSALYRLGCWHEHLYRPTHLNHPCTVWTSKSRGNFDWLVRHGHGLNDEYSRRFRYGIGYHKSLRVIVGASETMKRCQLDVVDMTPFKNCTTVSDPDLTIVERYRQYLKLKWEADGPLARWTKSSRPEW